MTLSGPPTGALRLRAVRLGERTVLTEVARTAPFHPGPASHRAGDGSAEVIIQQAGPGIFPGERLETTIKVEPGASLTVRGQGATKLYPSPSGTLAEIRTMLHVGPGASLIYLPGELIPFRDARLRQETTVELTTGARFALAEIVTPGRLAMGERDAFVSLDLRLRIVVDGCPVLIERSLLEPHRRPLTVVGRHGEHSCAGSLYLAGWPAPLPPESAATDTSVWRCSGETADGSLTIVRLLGTTAHALKGQVATELDVACVG